MRGESLDSPYPPLNYTPLRRFPRSTQLLADVWLSGDQGKTWFRTNPQAPPYNERAHKRINTHISNDLRNIQDIKRNAIMNKPETNKINTQFYNI